MYANHAKQKTKGWNSIQPKPRRRNLTSKKNKNTTYLFWSSIRQIPHPRSRKELWRERPVLRYRPGLRWDIRPILPPRMGCLPVGLSFRCWRLHFLHFCCSYRHCRCCRSYQCQDFCRPSCCCRYSKSMPRLQSNGFRHFSCSLCVPYPNPFGSIRVPATKQTNKQTIKSHMNK